MVCIPSSCLQRLLINADSRSEKPARGTLFTALQRQISLNNIVILDAPNYIKGFRYQIYCAAREFKVRVATVRLSIFARQIFLVDRRSKVGFRRRYARTMSRTECCTPGVRKIYS